MTRQENEKFYNLITGDEDFVSEGYSFGIRKIHNQILKSCEYYTELQMINSKTDEENCNKPLPDLFKIFHNSLIDYSPNFLGRQGSEYKYNLLSFISKTCEESWIKLSFYEQFISKKPIHQSRANSIAVSRCHIRIYNGCSNYRKRYNSIKQIDPKPLNEVYDAVSAITIKFQNYKCKDEQRLTFLSYFLTHSYFFWRGNQLDDKKIDKNQFFLERENNPVEKEKNIELFWKAFNMLDHKDRILVGTKLFYTKRKDEDLVSELEKLYPSLLKWNLVNFRTARTRAFDKLRIIIKSLRDSLGDTENGDTPE